MSKLHILFFTAVIPAVSLFSQGKADVFDILKQKSFSGGSVTVVQNDKIRRAFQNVTEKQFSEKGISGFRINIYFTSDKKAEELANTQQVQFISNYPDIPTYIRYDAPFFKVYVGDFRSKSDALKILKMIERNFPNAYIVQDNINFPRIE